MSTDGPIIGGNFPVISRIYMDSIADNPGLMEDDLGRIEDNLEVLRDVLLQTLT